jgi:hypothetical protein
MKYGNVMVKTKTVPIPKIWLYSISEFMGMTPSNPTASSKTSMCLLK